MNTIEILNKLGMFLEKLLNQVIPSSNQNLRQIGLRVQELWSDIQKNQKHYNFIFGDDMG